MSLPVVGVSEIPVIVILNESMDVPGGGVSGTALMITFRVALLTQVPGQQVSHMREWLQELSQNVPTIVRRSRLRFIGDPAKLDALSAFGVFSRAPIPQVHYTLAS
jgi:hypothetical protein